MNNPTKRTFYDWTLEILSFLSLLWAFVPLFFYGTLSPDKRIPIHYNALGEIDGWGDRYFLLFFPLGALLFYVGLFFLDRRYMKFNYPVKVTKENANALYRIAVRLIRHLKFFIVLLFAYLGNATLAIVMGNGTRLNRFILYTLIIGAFITLTVYYIKMVRLKGSTTNEQI